MNTIKAIAGDFGTWALPADAPAFVKRTEAERFIMVMTDAALDAEIAGEAFLAPTWAAIMAAPLSVERIAYGAVVEFVQLPARSLLQRIVAWFRA